MNEKFGVKHIIEEDVPVWLPPLLEKLKEDIGVEVSARISYNVRIMLDGVVGELKSQFIANQAHTTDKCICQETRKSKGCKEKRAGTRTFIHPLKMEDRKQLKSFHKERRKAAKQLKSSSTEGETEFEIPIELVTSASGKSAPSSLTKNLQREPPPVPPRVVRKSQNVPDLSSISGAVHKEKLDDVQLELASTTNGKDQLPQQMIFPTSFNETLLTTADKKSAITALANETEAIEISNLLSSVHLNQPSKASSTNTSQAMSMKSSLNASMEMSEGLMADSISPILSAAQFTHFGISDAAAEIFAVKSQRTSDDAPSDSEFEVVSLPPAAAFGSQAKYGYDGQVHMNSEFTDSEEESKEFHGTVIRGNPSTSSSSLKDGSSKVGTLYPLKELNQMSMTSNSSFGTPEPPPDLQCHITKDLASNSQDSVVEIERKRTPYFVSPEGVEKINSTEIGLDINLPEEFCRVRRPYSLPKPEGTMAPSNEPKERQGNPSPRQQPQTPTHQRERDPQPQPTNQRQQPQTTSQSRVDQQQQYEAAASSSHSPQPKDGSSMYRVDVLPEGLWDGAMTIGAQAYNATKNVVEKIQSSLASDQQPLDSSPMTESRGEGGSAKHPTPMQRLIDMGFNNYVLNSRLLSRYKNNVEDVIEELLKMDSW